MFKGLCISNLYIITTSPSKEVAWICTLATKGWRASTRLLEVHTETLRGAPGRARCSSCESWIAVLQQAAPWAKLLREVGSLDPELVWCHLEPGPWRNSLDHGHGLTCGHGMLMSRALCSTGSCCWQVKSSLPQGTCILRRPH